MVSLPVRPVYLQARPAPLGQPLPAPAVQVQYPVVDVFDQAGVFAPVVLSSGDEQARPVAPHLGVVAVNPARNLPHRLDPRDRPCVALHDKHLRVPDAAILAVREIADENHAGIRERGGMKVGGRKSLARVAVALRLAHFGNARGRCSLSSRRGWPGLRNREPRLAGSRSPTAALLKPYPVPRPNQRHRYDGVDVVLPHMHARQHVPARGLDDNLIVEGGEEWSARADAIAAHAQGRRC